MSVAEVIADLIGRKGPLPVGEVLEVALYDRVDGFYEAGGSAGRRDGDFLTSPEVGALFGAVVGRALDEWWVDMGRPDPFVVVEAGAGPGTLARMVTAAHPACSSALRYVMVDRSAAMRARHGERLQLEDPALVLPPIDPDSETLVPGAPSGPVFASLADLPRVTDVPVVVLANELLDNIPFDLAERRDGGWHEVRVQVGATPGPRLPGAVEGVGFDEILVPLDDVRRALLDRLVPRAPEGARVPLQERAGEWVRDALATAGPGGRVVVFDYAAETAELARRDQGDWLRTYRQHRRGGGYLDALGSQDVTCEVAVDQLASVQVPRQRTQREWLEAYGIEDLVAQAKTVWADRAHLADLEAMKARSRVGEADALSDPGGLGAFLVLEWESA